MTTATFSPACPPPASGAPSLSKEDATSLSAHYAVLADPVRLQILHAIKHADRPLCVCELASLFPIAQSTVSYHLARLRSLGFIDSEQRGIWSYFSLPSAPSPFIQQLLGLLP